MQRLESARQKIATLYPDQAEATFARLVHLLDEFAQRHPPRPRPPPGAPPFSERDAVLICYADHVQEPDTPTLRTLGRFLREFAAGGVNAVHLLPFYPSSSDDGFSVIDYTAVKPEFGDWAEVERIGSDFRLMVDLVINHCSAQSPWFQGFLAGDPVYARYFIAFDQPVDTSQVFRPRTHPLLTPFDTAIGRRYVWTTFSADQIDLNFANPEVLLAMVEALLTYLAHGASIIRLDAIAYLWKELGTPCIHLPQTHLVVKLLRDILDAVAPGTWIVTETNVPHRDNISYFGNGADEAHLVYNFTLPPLLLHSVLRQDATDLTRWAGRLSTPSETTTFFNFTASHDGIGVTPLQGVVDEAAIAALAEHAQRRGGRVSYRAVAGGEPRPYELNIVYLDAAGSVPAFLATQAIQLSLRGVPGIYLNSLIGARNWEEGVARLGYNRAINRQKFAYAPLASALRDERSEQGTVYRGYRHLLATRAAEPLFSPQVPQEVLGLDPRVVAVLRWAGEERLLTLASVAASAVALEAGAVARALEGREARDLLSGKEFRLIEGERLDLAPYQVMWLRR